MLARLIRAPRLYVGAIEKQTLETRDCPGCGIHPRRPECGPIGDRIERTQRHSAGELRWFLRGYIARKQRDFRQVSAIYR
jgi:hypothetical protein